MKTLFGGCVVFSIVLGLCLSSGGVARAQALAQTAPFTPAAAEPGVQYNVYFGNLHNHSTLSDGDGDPDQAYAHARDVAKLDFFALSDHAEQLLIWPWEKKWDTLKETAQDFYAPGQFVTLWGFEWSNPLMGHICVYNTNENASTVTDVSLGSFYGWIKDHPEGFAMFNHPGRQDSTGTEFNHFDLDSDVQQQIVGIETFNKGDGYDVYFHTDAYGSGKTYLDLANSKGWRVGASGGFDHHGTTWGSSTSFRTAVLATELTREAIIDAYRNRRFYSTENKDLYLDFRCSGYPMGAQLTGVPLRFTVSARDGGTDLIQEIALYRNGVMLDSRSVNDTEVSVSFTDPAPNAQDYYYVVVGLNVGDHGGYPDEAISSPIWCNDCEAVEEEGEGSVEGEGAPEGQFEGEGALEGQPEGVIEGEGSAEGLVEGEGALEGQPEGVVEGEGAAEGLVEGEGALEGQPEGVIEGEGSAEGLVEGEGALEGQPEGVVEGEGAAEGLIEGEGALEGQPEGVVEGEGSAEGFVEGEGALEGQPEGVVEGEGSAEGFVEGEGALEGQPEGVVEGEGVAEGLVEGEGALEGQPEGVVEGEGALEGQPEGVVEGEGSAEGLIEGEGVLEGEPEGVIEGEGAAEGLIEGEGVLEGQPEGVVEGEGAAEGLTEGEGQFDSVHTADQNGDGVISLTELLRVIQFFNLRGFHCVTLPDTSEDGFLPGAGIDQSCAAHSSDYAPQDWQISLTELLRLIQFFNLRGYHPCPEDNTEDGFCPGSV